MNEWKHIHHIWAPSWPKRIRMAWDVLRTGRYTVAFDYKMAEDPPGIWIDNEALIWNREARVQYEVDRLADIIRECDSGGSDEAE